MKYFPRSLGYVVIDEEKQPDRQQQPTEDVDIVQQYPSLMGEHRQDSKCQKQHWQLGAYVCEPPDF